MTNKRVIIVLSVLGLIAILLLVSSLVFKIKTIDVVYSTEQIQLEQTEASDVVEKSGIKVGGSIFFVNKNKATANIEKKLPYAKVESIESSFPNKITINISLREQQYVIKRSTETDVDYLICDGDLKVLSVETNVDKTAGLCELKIKADNLEAGDFINNQTASEISNYLSINGFKADKVKKYFTSIEFSENSLIFNTCFDTKIEIKDYKTKLREKINTAISIFTNSNISENAPNYEKGPDGELIADFSVFESNGKIVASF